MNTKEMCPTLLRLLAGALAGSMVVCTAASQSPPSHHRLALYQTSLAAAEAALRTHDVVSASRWLGGAPQSLRGWEWDYLNAQLDQSLASWQVSESRVNSTATSADGRWLVTGSGDGQLRLWSIASVRAPRTLEGHASAIVMTRFSMDGKRLVSLSADGILKIWENDSGRQIGHLTALPGAISAAAISPDLERLAVASYSAPGSYQLWNLPARRKTDEFAGHEFPVVTLSFSPDGGSVASSSFDGQIKLWDVETSTNVAQLKGHEPSKGGTVRGLAFSPDGKLLASASEDQTIRIWDLASGETRSILRGHRSPLSTAAFSADGRVLATGSALGNIKIWESQTGELQTTLSGHRNLVRSLSFAAGGRLISADDDGVARLWLPAPQRPDEPSGYKNAVWTVRFDHSGDRVAGASWGGWIRVLDALGRLQFTLLQETPYAVAFSADGRGIATGSYSGVLKLWDEKGALRTENSHGGRSLNVLQYNPDGTILASGEGEGDGMISFWDPDSGQLMRQLEGHSAPVTSLIFVGGNRLISGSYDRTIRLWDVATGVQLKVIGDHERAINGLAFAPRSGILASASSDQTIKLWNIDTGEALRTLTGHDLAVQGVAFHPDGTRLASTSADRTIRLWDPASGAEMVALRGHHREGFSISFSPDGSQLAVGTYDPGILILDAVPISRRHGVPSPGRPD